MLKISQFITQEKEMAEQSVGPISVSVCDKGVVCVCDKCGAELVRGERFLQGLTNSFENFTYGLSGVVTCCDQSKAIPIIVDGTQPIPKFPADVVKAYCTNGKELFMLEGLDIDARGPLRLRA